LRPDAVLRAVTLRARIAAGGTIAGYLVTLGVVTFGVVGVAVDATLTVVGVEPGPVRLTVGTLVPLWAAVYAATWAAAVDRHGFAALWRGARPFVLFQHAALSGITLLGVGEAGWLAARALTALGQQALAEGDWTAGRAVAAGMAVAVIAAT
jgi:hypothetical protein